MNTLLLAVFVSLFVSACTRSTDRLSVRERDVSTLELPSVWKSLSAGVWDVRIPQGDSHHIELVVHLGPEQFWTTRMRLDPRDLAVQIVRLKLGRDSEKWLICTPTGFAAMEGIVPERKSETSPKRIEVSGPNDAVTFFRGLRNQEGRNPQAESAEVRLLKDGPNGVPEPTPPARAGSS